MRCRSLPRPIGSAGALVGPGDGGFSVRRSRVGRALDAPINDGLPWWIFDRTRRVPGTTAFDYLKVARLLRVADDAAVGDVLDCSGPLYDRLLGPVLLAALNIDPREGAATLASAVMRETLALGGKACRPLIAREGLSHAFIEPAMKHLKARGVEVRLEHELRGMRFEGGRVSRARFRIGSGRSSNRRCRDRRGADACRGGAGARADGAAGLPLDRQRAFQDRRAARRAADAGAGQRDDRVDFCVRRAAVGDDQQRRPPDGRAARRACADDLAEVAKGHGNCRRPAAVADRARAARDLRGDARRECQAPRRRATQWENLFLAGDWTATGLPATFEGAIALGQPRGRSS